MNNNNRYLKFGIIGILMIIVVFFLYFRNQPDYQAQGLDWLFGNNEEQTDSLTDEDLATIINVYDSINAFYIDEVDRETLVEGALKGMVEATGDPYSEFLNSEESTEMNQDIEGSFQGIGVQFIMQNDQVTVVAPIEGTPASEAGIQPNDVILEADGQELTGLNTNEVVDLIRGPEGSSVNLLIQRGDSTFEVDLERAEIPIITVTGELAETDPNIGVVQITQFNGTTHDELIDVVTELRNEGATEFVFDLRYNPGGLLDQALSISNMFLEDGENIMQMEEAQGEPVVYEASDSEYGDFQITEDYALLVNDGSASASEILAAAIKENTDAPIVGTTTFGKGTVQTVLDQGAYGELKLTFAQWLSPSGESINEVGVTPTNEVEPEPIEGIILLNPDDTLAEGQSSEEVRSLSIILNSLGYDVESENYYNEEMMTAVESFQEDNDLEVTGEVTGDTANALNTQAREYLEENDPQLDAAVEMLAEDNESTEDEAA